MAILSTPILFLVFNRPNTTRQVFEKIREVKPKQLFIAADGPRVDKPGESEICGLVRSIATAIDWDCELKILFRDENLGCGKAVSEGITWFFEHVEEGIILEDDCLPDTSFFPFCAELLVKYRAEEKVMSISGSNLLGYLQRKNEASYFWGHGGIWGWATWKRAWQLYDFSMGRWNDETVKIQISKAIKNEDWFQFYKPMFDACFIGTLDTWDIQWFYTILLNNGLSVNPEVNLVKNIGFGIDSTHTGNSKSPISSIPVNSLLFPLKHPDHRVVDVEQLTLMYRALHPFKKVRSNIFRRILNVLRH